MKKVERKKRMTGFEKAMEDVRMGRVTEYASIEEMIEEAMK